MEKKFLHYLTIFFLIMPVLVCSKVYATDLMENRLHINGFIENQTALRLEDGVNEAGKLSRMRTTLQVELGVDLLENLKFFTIARGFFDASSDLQNGLIETADTRSSVPEGEHMKRDFDLREYYLKGRWGGLSYKVGRQQIAWGETDLFRMADIINPLDLSWRGNYESFDNIRIPLRMIDLVYEFPGQNDFKIELVANPEDFRPIEVAAPGANWDPVWKTFGYDWQNQGTIPFAQAFWGQMQDDLKDLGDHDLDNFQGGARLRGKLGSFDASLFYYYSRAESAVAVADFTKAPFPMRFEWPRVQTLGGTFNVPESLTDSIIRFECAYTFDQPFGLDHPFIPGLPDTEYAEKDTFAFMLGFDRPTWITILNPNKTFFISGQWFNRFIISPDSSKGINSPINDRLQTGMGDDGRSDYQTVATLLINTGYWDDRITPQLLGAYGFREKGYAFIPSVEYQPTTYFSILLGAVITGAKKDTAALFGPWKNNDEVYLHLKYTF